MQFANIFLTPYIIHLFFLSIFLSLSHLSAILPFLHIIRNSGVTRFVVSFWEDFVFSHGQSLLVVLCCAFWTVLSFCMLLKEIMTDFIQLLLVSVTGDISGLGALSRWCAQCNLQWKGLDMTNVDMWNICMLSLLANETCPLSSSW